MSNLVIVAIPDENDRVWKISSEKVPHMTVLFLGEVDEVANLEQIIGFVEHAANTSLNRFSMTVDRRDELGADQADVIFFKKDRYDYKAIRDFRVALLQDNNIKTAYDSATQFEGPWKPHLTLGYPAAPAKEDNDDFPLYDVRFNKIAVWVDDFDGPEFLLKDYWDEWEAMEAVPMDVAMSDIQHYGVKGMRWGVRKENVASGTKAVGRGARAVGRGLGKAIDFAGDVQFENMAADGRAREQVIGGARKPYRKEDLPAVKARHGDYAKLRNRAKKPFSKEARAYRKDARETYIQRLETTANSMKNLSGDREYTIRERGYDLPAQGGELPVTKYFWNVTTRKVQHAVTDPFTRLEVIFDDEGYITDLKQVEIEDSMAQAIEMGAAFLAHYGVKGMKWGVRKTPQEEGGRREGIQRYLDPQGHDLTIDVLKTLGGVLVPIAQPLTWPAQIRLVRGGIRGAQAKVLDSQEKKFAKKAMSPKNFAAIHNGSLEQVNRGIDKINAKYPNPNQSPATRKKYDAEVLKTMQDGYRASANSLTNKAQTRHLDVEFVNDGLDFKIHAREGAPTPLPKRVKHAAEDIENEEITVEITGKIKRNQTGHIVGFEFDHLKSESMAQSVSDVGAEFVLEHYGVKGMRWGYRKERPTAVNPTARSFVPHGKKRKTKVKTEGGENQPASDDAIRVGEARAKLKRSGTAALSNQELRDVANRLQLEAQVATLTSSRGQKFIMRELETTGQQLTKRGVKSGAKSVAKNVTKKKVKKAAATAAVAALL